MHNKIFTYHFPLKSLSEELWTLAVRISEYKLQEFKEETIQENDPVISVLKEAIKTKYGEDTVDNWDGHVWVGRPDEITDPLTEDHFDADAIVS